MKMVCFMLEADYASHIWMMTKHSVLLPKEERVTQLIMQWWHSKCAHGGRGLTLNELRSCGYWVICGNAAVKKMIFHWVQCRRLCGRLVEQIMADLPYCRVVEAPAFTFCGVDMFGPFMIKQEDSSQALQSNVHLHELSSSTHWDHSFPWHWFIDTCIEVLNC